jgi:N-acylneuraminate cytidylyltransferase
VAITFARGGSKGLPGKNIALLAGKPLIAYAIETALHSALVDRVVVSTDDPEIARVAQAFGAEIPFMRPAELAQDRTPEWLAWQHAIRELGLGASDVFLSIPTTAPLRSVEDVDACITCLRETDADVVITVTEAQRNPYFNMVTLNADSEARLVIQPSEAIAGRQAAPAVFDMTTVAYAARPSFVMSSAGLFEGSVRAVLVPRERALDIDTPLDLRLAELMLQGRESAA